MVDAVSLGGRRLALVGALALAFGLVSVGAARADVQVPSTGSPTSPFSQNKSNEPGLAVDASNPQILAAGANEERDMEACAAGDPTTCPFTQGVGSSGIYFSGNGGGSWTQPTYTGWTARDCLGPAACQPHVGPIGTLPNYYEQGLVSDGDPSLAFGPQPLPGGGFSYANGARLYYGNLTANFATTRTDQTFKGFEAIAVSHTDDLTGTGGNSAWSNPVIVSRQNAALFSDKDAIWADNASSSKFFGNLYVCNTSFRSQEKGNGIAEPILFYSSTDGGDTFSGPKQLTAATGNGQTGGRQGCAVRTDSQGRVYVFWSGTDIHTRSADMEMATSDNGGRTFTRPRVIAQVTPVGIFDPIQGDVSFDGDAGARTDSFPSVDIANGAPDGSAATNELVVTWSDGKTPTSTGEPNEKAKVIYSTDRGRTFHSAGSASPSSDRPDFPAVAIDPNGKDVWITYTNFEQPFQATTANPRMAQGVVRHASVGSSGGIGSFSTVERGPSGDARGSSSNDLTTEFIGDYSYAAAAPGAGSAVWNDVRNAADCPAIDTYRQKLVDNDPSAAAPDVEAECPPNFGNSDIFEGTFTFP